VKEFIFACIMSVIRLAIFYYYYFQHAQTRLNFQKDVPLNMRVWFLMGRKQFKLQFHKLTFFSQAKCKCKCFEGFLCAWVLNYTIFNPLQVTLGLSKTDNLNRMITICNLLILLRKSNFRFDHLNYYQWSVIKLSGWHCNTIIRINTYK